MGTNTLMSGKGYICFEEINTKTATYWEVFYMKGRDFTDVMGTILLSSYG